jgi:hypothetical protein
MNLNMNITFLFYHDLDTNIIINPIRVRGVLRTRIARHALLDPFGVKIER